ncbi:hypothetical protein [Nodosilinea nodulosa]|uniref:hypothetical protein n=1 Tax=Nodosilinea nodulosa TaxID=416001 RepID=UPI0002D469CC|nr:hypothetical protein [Nodosilinea nodulosa]
MQSSVYRDLKWNRLLLTLLVTLVVADTVPCPQLSPGLLHFVAVHVQAAARGGQ